jgi:membrane-bound serine protease (ClpP class)
MEIVWAALLMLLAIGLIVAEILSPPPYGIIGFLAVVSAGASVFVAFKHDAATGWIFAAVGVVGLPAAVGLAIRHWPNTSMGRRVLLDAPSANEVLSDADPRYALQELIGRVGKAKTLMLPGGAVSIDGRTYEAVSEGMPIEIDCPVRVMQVRHNRLVVRKIEGPIDASQCSDPLAQPAESLGIEPLDEPLA